MRRKLLVCIDYAAIISGFFVHIALLDALYIFTLK